MEFAKIKNSCYDLGVLLQYTKIIKNRSLEDEKKPNKPTIRENHNKYAYSRRRCR
jgi:hypothetical protein